jgi:hypothetical protein
MMLAVSYEAVFLVTAVLLAFETGLNFSLEYATSLFCGLRVLSLLLFSIFGHWHSGDEVALWLHHQHVLFDCFMMFVVLLAARRLLVTTKGSPGSLLWQYGKVMAKLLFLRLMDLDLTIVPDFASNLFSLDGLVGGVACYFWAIIWFGAQSSIADTI